MSARSSRTSPRHCNIVSFSRLKHKLVHSNGIVHRDVKPQNLLIAADGTAKLTDFSTAERVGTNDMLKKTAGTYQFFAPESCNCKRVFNGRLAKNTDGVSGRASDIWALGVTMYAMLYNRLPFWGGSIIDILDAIANKPYLCMDNDVDWNIRREERSQSR